MQQIIKYICLAIISAMLLACVENSAPVADAGPDITVSSNDSTLVELSAMASYDPNGDEISYHWSIEGRPPGSEASLSSFSDAIVEITLDVEGIYTISLVVDDGKSHSPKDQLSIFYGNEMAASQNENTDHFGVMIDGRACRECHQLVDVDGNVTPHIDIAGDCNGCHSLFAWRPVSRVDHALLFGSCESCHDGQLAMGKSVNHIESSNDCGICHITVTWTPALHVNHQAVIGECIDCHNGVIASGKSVNHIESLDQCEMCHSTFSWLNTFSANNGSADESEATSAGSGGNSSSSGVKILFDHTGIIDNCDICHNAQVAQGFSTSHIQSSERCEACHSTVSFIPTSRVDHNEVMGSCISCHNNVVATSKTVHHIASSDVCDACHSTANWNPVITVDHAQVLGTCNTCHRPPASHVNTGIVSGCQDCHDTFKWASPTNPLPPLVASGGGFPG